MNERERIGKRIAEIRKETGISQAKLAEMSGLDQGHIARIELGKYNVGIDTLSKIAEVFNKKIEII
jgi:transcriptional regulator with XRE-family HTH domain